MAFHYAPEASSSGVLRSLKYTRYLPEYGWRVTVLTLEPSAYTVVDGRLLDQIPSSVRVVRTRYVNTKRHVSIAGRYLALTALPDPWIGWLPWAVAAGRRIFRADPYDLVYSTSPHATAQLIALLLARRSGRPWVADFRDPWYEDVPEIGAPSGRLFRSLDRSLEGAVVRNCSCVTTTTDHLRELLRCRYPAEKPAKFVTIMNGFDEADFVALPEMQARSADRLTIVHAGAIHPSFRDPSPLFRALRLAATNHGVDASRFAFRFLGAGPYADAAALRRCIADSGLGDNIAFLPRVSYDEALHALAEADVLLLLQASEDTKGLVPAKLFEYLRAQRPVLAAVPPGSSADIIRETMGGWAVDPADDGALVNVLAEIYDHWRRGTLADRRADLARLSRFDRRHLTGELAAIFERLAGEAAAR